MKKTIVSPLCSGLVIPGLGQVINQDLKKGVCILSLVFILFIAGIIKLYRIMSNVLGNMDMNQADPGMIMARLRAEDPSILWYLLLALAVLWFYSVLDAYLRGKKIDQSVEGDRI